MSDLHSLLEAKARVEAEIAAAKPAAVAQVFALMEQLGVTPADMGLKPARPVLPPGKNPIRFRDSAGNTWTGIGKRPNWVRAVLASGASIEAYRVLE